MSEANDKHSDQDKDLIYSIRMDPNDLGVRRNDDGQ